jgi:8-oxo-dGTP pyrophosphatase MutT (NUDIX family)
MKTKPRAAAILIDNNKIAMIERRLAMGSDEAEYSDEAGELVYYVFPGGHVEEGELPAEAVIREIHEELGLNVAIQRLVAESTYLDRRHYYYLAERTGGIFGTGYGKELSRPPHSPRGSVTPVWVALEKLNSLVVYPTTLVEFILQGAKNGWPEEIYHFQESEA